MLYPGVNTFFDELLPSGLRHYWKANAFSTFSEHAHSSYGRKYKRLPEIKARYDPANLFRVNQYIEPA